MLKPRRSFLTQPTPDNLRWRTAGFGVQLEVADLNGDQQRDVVAANKQGTFVFLNEAKKVSEEDWQNGQPKLLQPGSPQN